MSGDGTWGLLVNERVQDVTLGFLVSERVGMAPGGLLVSERVQDGTSGFLVREWLQGQCCVSPGLGLAQGSKVHGNSWRSKGWSVGALQGGGIWPRWGRAESRQVNENEVGHLQG